MASLFAPAASSERYHLKVVPSCASSSASVYVYVPVNISPTSSVPETETSEATGGVFAGGPSISSLKLSMAHSSLFPLLDALNLRVIVVPVPGIDFENSLNVVVKISPSPIPSPLVSPASDLLLVPLEVLLLAKKRRSGW